MQDLLTGIGVLIIVFVLIIVLGLQMQIRNLSGKVDEILRQLTK